VPQGLVFTIGANAASNHRRATRARIAGATRIGLRASPLDRRAADRL